MHPVQMAHVSPTSRGKNIELRNNTSPRQTLGEIALNGRPAAPYGPTQPRAL